MAFIFATAYATIGCNLKKRLIYAVFASLFLIKEFPSEHKQKPKASSEGIILVNNSIMLYKATKSVDQNLPPPPPCDEPDDDECVLEPPPLELLSFGLAVLETVLYRYKSLLSVITILPCFT